MSGTSLDGVDGVLVDFNGGPLRVLASASKSMPLDLRNALLALNSAGNNELHNAALAANALARMYAEVCEALLLKAQLPANAIRAIGAHGQTVRHQPGAWDGTGYTLQLNQPALLAECTGIDVVADFRSRDVAAGGQGAPLVPPFHQALFGQLSGISGILNIGGISNLTVLRSDAPEKLLGFDCGPGNALLDHWCQQHTGAAYDANGDWAAQGDVDRELLRQMLSDPYFAKPVPKSTGRDLFNAKWLEQQLAQHSQLSAVTVQATLTELTASSCADTVLRWAPGCERLIVCGGGAYNRSLMARLQSYLPACQVSDSSEFGLPPLEVEATAFAWLARQCVLRLTGNRPSVTGAAGERVLGAIYPR